MGPGRLPRHPGCGNLADIMLRHNDRGYEAGYDPAEYDPRAFSDIKDSPPAIKLALDRSCDRAAGACLAACDPDLQYVGEESWAPGPITTDFFWCVDPICGSMGYYKKTGFFGTSVALVHRVSGPGAAAMYCPPTRPGGVASRDRGVVDLLINTFKEVV